MGPATPNMRSVKQALRANQCDAGAAASVPLISAIATLNECSVAHASDGNVFEVRFGTIDDGSESSICGSSDKAIRSSAGRFSVNVKGNIDCQTNNILGNKSTMVLEVRLDKQSPSVQRDALVNGLTAAFGSAGVSIDKSKCNISGIPT